MTTGFIDERVGELRRVANALIEQERADTGSDLQKSLMHEALFSIERAIADLIRAKTGVLRAN